MEASIPHLTSAWFEEIESPEFALRLAVASNAATLRAAIRLESAPAAVQRSQIPDLVVFHRLSRLCSIQPDDDFSNPFDGAIAAYYWILANRHSPLERSAWAAIRDARNVYWAPRLASFLSQEEADRRAQIPLHTVELRPDEFRSGTADTTAHTWGLENVRVGFRVSGATHTAATPSFPSAYEMETPTRWVLSGRAAGVVVVPALFPPNLPFVYETSGADRDVRVEAEIVS